MRKSIAASIRISEIRDRLVELDAIETRSTEQESEQTALMAERTTKEAEFRGASKAEEEAELHPRDFDVLPETRGTYRASHQDRPGRLPSSRCGRS